MRPGSDPESRMPGLVQGSGSHRIRPSETRWRGLPQVPLEAGTVMPEACWPGIWRQQASCRYEWSQGQEAVLERSHGMFGLQFGLVHTHQTPPPKPLAQISVVETRERGLDWA
jgi:hypothetical protein